jgi:putative methionine-R-sulfoxide reductase with GAF domain
MNDLTDLTSLGDLAPAWEAVLGRVLEHFCCATGTLHRTGADGLLHLQAQRGIPPFLLDKIDRIPVGKGIAGCAAERNEAVQMCNLQTDTSGVARPDAKQTKVEGALAVPIRSASGRVLGVLGIGKMQPYEFTEEEISALQQAAQVISRSFEV